MFGLPKKYATEHINWPACVIVAVDHNITKLFPQTLIVQYRVLNYDPLGSIRGGKKYS